MKFETKLNRILAMEDSKLKLSKLYTLAFNCIPSSPNQITVKQYINDLLKKGYKLA